MWVNLVNGLLQLAPWVATLVGLRVLPKLWGRARQSLGHR